MKNFFFLFLLLTLFSACTNDDNNNTPSETITKAANPMTQLNPNGDSELALLMRKMEAHWKEIKKDIESGQKIESIPDYSNLLTATPTDESMTADGYEGYVHSYLNQVKALGESSSNPKTAYNNIVNGCVLCHENSCSGPIPRIKKLLIN